MAMDDDVNLLRFVAAMNVARTGLQHEQFCKDLTPDKARRRLAKTGHTFCEYMQGKGTLTKLYLDRDVRLAPGEMPTPERIALEERAVHEHVEDLIQMLTTDKTNLSYRLATRHGVPNPRAPPGSKDACHKLSFRPFLLGLKIRYSEIPALIFCAKQELFWDMTVYKSSEQLLASIGGCKGNMRDGYRDERLLVPVPLPLGDQMPTCDLLDYVAQYFDPNWPTLDLSREFVAQQTAEAEERRTLLSGRSMASSSSSSSLGPEYEARSQYARIQTQTSPPASPRFVKALVACLSPKTAGDRQQWIRVAMALRNEAAAHNTDGDAIHDRGQNGEVDEAYFQAWMEFSRKSTDKFQGETDCRKTWDSIKLNCASQRKVSIGSLCLMASADDADEYRRAQSLNKADSMGVKGFKELKELEELQDLTVRDTVKVERAELYRRLMLDMWPEHFEGRMNKFVMGEPEGEDGKKTVAFRDDESGLRGCVMQDYSVRVMALSGEVVYLGSLNDDNVMVNNLARISNTLDPDAEYMYMRSLKMDGATLQRMDAREDDPVVHMNSPFTKDQTMCVRAKGKKTLNVTAKLANQVFMDVASKSHQYVERKHGLTLFQVNHFNNCVFNVANDTHGMRADSDLAKAWISCTRSHGDGAHTSQIVKTNEAYYYFMEDVGTWQKTTCTDMVCNRMLSAMESYKDGAFFDSLNESEKKYVKSIRGGTAVFRRALNDFFDPQFEKKLDADMNLLPFDNGVYILNTGDFRPLRWSDYVTTTIGYAYVKHPPDDEVELVDRFFKQVLPLPEERELFLRLVGTALCGMPLDKKFVVMQDYRDGDNGKSVAIKTVEAAFGNFCMPNQPAFLGASSHTNPNGHESNMLAYKGKRLAIFDETDPNMRFDLAKLKSLTGGAPRLAARGAGLLSVTEFRWSAFILIACNKGCLPQVDSTDAAFVNRMVPIPMRAKFNNDLAAAGEPFSHPKDCEIERKLRSVRMAVLQSLLDALQRHKSEGGNFDTLPVGCMELRAAIVMDSDNKLEAVASFVDQNVNFTLERTADLRGRRILGVLKRDDLVEGVKASDRTGLFRGIKAAAMKSLVDTVMAAKGYPLVMKATVDGVQHCNVYKDCEMRECQFFV
jgi:hypothetical protein